MKLKKRSTARGLQIPTVRCMVRHIGQRARTVIAPSKETSTAILGNIAKPVLEARRHGHQCAQPCQMGW